MEILLDGQGFVSSYVVGDAQLTGGIHVDDILMPDDFEDRFYLYRFDGVFIFDNDKDAADKLEKKIQKIRDDRERICFPIVNRGGLWYDLLTEQQKNEMLDWYMAWLDAPETLIEPEMPKWLEEMI